MNRPRGLYDLVVTESVARFLSAADADDTSFEALEGESAAERIAEVLAQQLRALLEEAGGEPDARSLKQLALTNELLREFRDRSRSDHGGVEQLATPPRVLRAVFKRGERAPVSPETGLASPWLFTAGPASPALLTELRREAAACDGIDILVSFITVSGVRKFLDVFRSVTAADASGGGRTRIRVLTTTYMGATQVEAIDDLARLNGCEVRVSLTGERSKLHAKAWLFTRRTGFGSAYVGSANLSHTALAAGLEWTVKFTEQGQATLFVRAQAQFDTLWEDPEFQRYDPADEVMRAAVRAALGRSRGEDTSAGLVFFDIQPKHYQQEMLAQLERERAHGRTRNLVVAATGTGKTVVAALDYRNTCARLGHRPRLLFVAHRAQILRQARETYRQVLRDHSFGELLTGGLTPVDHGYLFASIDSLASKDLVAKLGGDYWHTVVIDECHRLAASRFDALARAITPAHLLGLTATPERADGQPIESYFSPRPDRSPSVELRLWDALNLQLLSPFEYFACDDETDFSEVPWQKPGESRALDNLVTGNSVRARMIINEWTRLSGNPRSSRALVFCVSVAHARFMAEQFVAAGLPAASLVGDTLEIDRRRAIRRLENGELCALITVDLFNEGVDLPTVDTLLLLRPTQSPVLFQQQIGRGLRLAPRKEACLILDFVGQHRVEFRFDRLLSSITGLSRRALEEAVDEGFSSLPPGCHIHLQRKTREQVLHSLRALTTQSWRRLRSELLAYAALQGKRRVSLGDFLHEQRLVLTDVYRSSTPSGWTTLKREAGLAVGEATADEEYLSRRFEGLLHVTDPEQIAFMRSISFAGSDPSPRSDEEAVRAQMFTYQVDGSQKAVSAKSFLARVGRNPACVSELAELADVLEAQSDIDPKPIPGLADVPLRLHASYKRNEILSAVGFLSGERYLPFQAGVLALKDRKTELLLVTLDKSSKGFHDRIAYRDYAVSTARFHWQSQNSAGPDTTAGRRYLESPGNGWKFQLFVRLSRDHAYKACGPVSLVHTDDAHGDRPMSITWTLDVPLPIRLFREFSALRGAI